MTKFKCLSISQPFADLVVKGKKRIETRKWNTKYRGEFLVHSPRKIRIHDCKRLKIDERTLVVGVIIGKATIYDVKEYQTKKEWHVDKQLHFASDNFSDKKFGFMLKNAKEFNIPIPCKGKLGFFDVELQNINIKENDIASEIFDEEYRTRWINRH